ncbi:MAG: exodeoxyribonuclease III [Patescibacteria group bacterium]
MKIISWNTNGLRATIKQGNFDPLFKKENPDIVCLQEVKAEAEQIPEKYRNYSGYHSFFSHPKHKKGYSGVAIYTKEKPQDVFYGMGLKGDGAELDEEGRLLGVKFKNFTLITGYYPNGGSGPHRLEYKLKFYDAFLKFILKLRKNGENVIFCGDVNTAHEAVDLARPKANEENTGFLPIERAWITKVIENDFLDIWREKNKDKKDVYTYWDQKTRARDRNVGWRIDYFFIDKTLEKKVKDVGTIQDYMGSDHCPIYIEL